MADINGRTHEPSLREVTSQLDGLKELMDERDRRYEERFKAMDEKTGLALTSSEKAVTKAETATEKRFDSVNEFRDTLRDQAALLMPRPETQALFKAYEEKIENMKGTFQKTLDDHKEDINNLQMSRSEGGGKEKATQHNVAVLMSGAALLIAIIALVLRAFGK
jgi:hypothetical protein